MKASWWYFAALFISVMLVGVVSIEYSNYVSNRNTSSWCDIVTTLDNTYRVQPPTTETGRKLAVEMHQLRTKFKCK